MTALEHLIKHFAASFPALCERAVNYKILPGDRHELHVEFSDGRAAIYDSVFDGCTFYDDVESMEKDSVDGGKEKWRRMFGRKLYRYSLMKHMTENDISAKSGVSQSTISRIFTGTSDASLWNFVRIAKAIGLNEKEIWNALGMK